MQQTDLKAICSLRQQQKHNQSTRLLQSNILKLTDSPPIKWDRILVAANLS